jgi:CDGSH-type Zn-finger protein/uncharacterized Fe-S cluster protein YjdI
MVSHTSPQWPDDATSRPSEEPQIIVHDREQLAYLLTEAAEIEHGLMCCYLYAAYSLKHGAADGLSEEEAVAVARWRGVIASIAVEEMLHLALVSNLLAAIGFAPQFARPNFPVAPGYHPSGVVIALAPFDLATLDHFIFLERPEGVEIPDGGGFEPPPPAERVARSDRLFPSSEDYATVGHLYRGIRHGFSNLAATLGEVALFAGDPVAQVGPDIAALCGLIAVTDLASALRAIDTIVEQGEGTASDSEQSHYRRFLNVRDEYRRLVTAQPAFQPAHPVARNPVMRKPPTPLGKVHVDEPRAARLMDLGNALYGHTLRLLTRAFGQAQDTPAQRRVLVGAAIDTMMLMSPVAELLCRMPAGAANPGINAGLSFAMARSTMGAQQCANWPLLAERTRELASGFAQAAEDFGPGLASTTTRLLEVALRLERSSPAVTVGLIVAPILAPHSIAMPSADVPATETTAPAIEEARGEHLVLRFEGKRCIHSRHCVLDAPDVFRANVKGPWLNPDGAAVEALVAVAHNCPSGAIQYERLDGGPAETSPLVNMIGVRENGPLAFHASISLQGHGDMSRATLCRCGGSKNKPYCDNSHLTLKFAATGEPPTQPSEPLAQRAGRLEVIPTPHGPLALRGNVEICSGTGRTVARVELARLCRCGGSANKPFCDGTHARIGFKAL